MSYFNDAEIIEKAMEIVKASDKWADATIELNGHSIDPTDGFDHETLEMLAHHKPTLRKLGSGLID